MFNNTISIFNKILDDIRKFARGWNIFLQISFIIYFSYRLYSKTGNQIVTTILLGLTILYLIYFLFFNKNITNTAKKAINLTFKYSKKTVNLFTIITSLYLIINNPEIDKITTITTIATTIFFILQILIDIISFVLEYYISLLIQSVKMDAEPIIKLSNSVNKVGKVFTDPVTTATNIINAPIKAIAKKLQKNDDNKKIKPKKIKLTKEEKMRAKITKIAENRNQRLQEEKAENKKKEKEDSINSLKANLGIIFGSKKRKKV